MDAIVNALYKCNPFTAVSHVFDDFSALLNTTREGNEFFKNFETRFVAQMSRYIAHGLSVALPPNIVTLLLLANTNVGGSQRVTILFSDSANASTSVTADSTNDDLIMLVEYEATASVICQFDNESRTSSCPSSSVHDFTLSSSAVNTPKSSSANNNNYASRRYRTMNAEQLRLYKLNVRCNDCDEYGHFDSDHNTDGSIKHCLPSNVAPPANDRNSSQNQENNRNAVMNFDVISPCRGSDS